MRRFATLWAAAALLALPLATVQAAGTPALAVHIEVETSFISEGISGGPFTATGPAVDAGLICPTGDTIDVLTAAMGYQSPGDSLSLFVVKEFTCENGDAFFVKLEVRLDQRGDHYSWATNKGTGDYAFLRGAGRGYGDEPEGDYDVLDVYNGYVTNRS